LLLAEKTADDDRQSLGLPVDVEYDTAAWVGQDAWIGEWFPCAHYTIVGDLSENLSVESLITRPV
jgi:hypothetical protein